MDEDERKKYMFLLEYEKLCKKHGFIIDSCNCCDGPHLAKLDEYYDGPEIYLEEYMKHLRRFMPE